jgi:hypothetical protein
MRTHLTPLRGALALLLVGSAILFIVGSTIERNHRHHETTAAKPAVTPGEKGTETSGEGSKPSATHAEAGHSEAGVKILGVNTESLALSIVAVVLSLLLAAAVLARVWARMVLLAVAAFALVFAAGDGRELVHQLDDSNAGLASVAGVLMCLHLIVALLAAFLLARRAGGAGSPVVTPAS